MDQYCKNFFVCLFQKLFLYSFKIGRKRMSEQQTFYVVCPRFSIHPGTNTKMLTSISNSTISTPCFLMTDAVINSLAIILYGCIDHGKTWYADLICLNPDLSTPATNISVSLVGEGSIYKRYVGFKDDFVLRATKGQSFGVKLRMDSNLYTGVTVEWCIGYFPVATK